MKRREGGDTVKEVNVRIGDKKTFDDYGLRLENITIGFPETKTNLIDIPGADGSLDLSEILGDVVYKNRKIELGFDAFGAYDEWHLLCTNLANYLHGKKMRVILDTDPYYYYTGRLELSTKKSNDTLHTITLEGTMDPYKYELQSSLEEWLWDPFSFRVGIIRRYKDLKVDGSLVLTIPGLKKSIIPTITASTSMSVQFEGSSYALKQGINKVYRIVLKEGENQLTFTGTGTVSVDYRGGIL